MARASLLSSVQGSGPPLLLVPGLDGTGELFYRQVPLLAPCYRVGVVRLPDDAPSMDALVDEVDAAVRALAPGGEPVTLVGESFGGALSMSYAVRHQARLARLVILNSFPYFTPQARLWLGHHALKLMPWGMMATVRELTSWRMHSPHTGREELREFHRRMRATTRAGYLSRLAILRRYDVRPHLPSLRVPTLFLAADRDHLVPAVTQARLMASLVPGSTVRVLEGHGHICLIAPDLDLCAILAEWAGAAPTAGATAISATAGASRPAALSGDAATGRAAP